MTQNCEFENPAEQSSLVVDPILVYQMGKVGSDSIVHSLEQLGLSNSVHHIHVLSHQIIQRSLESIRKHNRPFPIQLQQSIAVRDYLDRGKALPMRVITAVREPISQLISSEFQNIPDEMPHLIDDQGVWKQRSIQDYLLERVEGYDVNREWNCNWFDFDFKPALEIDVYERPIDMDSGVATFEQNGIRVLVLRLESSEHWSKAITEFLGLDSELELTQQNTAANKNYTAVYKSVNANLRFTAPTLERIYSSKYCRHFYSQSMIQEFKAKWNAAPGGLTGLPAA